MRTVNEVMSQPVKTVTTTDVVGPIRDLMLDEDVHGVPVVDERGKVVGIVTSSDLVEEWAPAQGVTTVMSSHVATVSPNTSLVDAARRMLLERIHHLVVEERGTIVGVVSSFDLLRELAGAIESAESLGSHARPAAKPGDLVVIRGHAIDRPERRGVIVDVRGADGGPPFMVRWLDDPHDQPHEVLFFPGSDADIEPHEA